MKAFVWDSRRDEAGIYREYINSLYTILVNTVDSFIFVIE